MSFGEQLRAARESKGYTQQQIADYMKIDKSTYCGYETGKRQPDVQKIKQLSEILGVSGDDLLETGFSENRAFPLSEKDRREIAKNLEQMMAQLEDGSNLMFDGDPMSDEARESIRQALQMGLEIAKVKNKETYTPKKYRKG